MKTHHFFAFVIAAFLVVSCSKTHSPNPLPPNFRMHSLELVSSINGAKLKNENYTFGYDNRNRLNKYVYSSNDTAYYNLIVKFFYADSISKIYKTYYTFDDSIILRVDSFLVNSTKQVINEWTPYCTNMFQYNGVLLSQLTTATFNTTLYNALDGDFYKSTSTISYDSSQTFLFYTNLQNRMGDYFQLRSFINYGQNIYQNKHLIKQSISSGYTTDVIYVIDADSKITQTTAKVVDSVGNSYLYIYNIGYEKY